MLKLYRSVGSDILTVAKCSHKVRPQPGHRDAPRGRGGGSSDTHLANREASAPVADEQMPPQLQQYQGQMGELQERVEYVRSLNDVIRHCFRPLAPDEENQENAVSVRSTAAGSPRAGATALPAGERGGARAWPRPLQLPATLLIDEGRPGLTSSPAPAEAGSALCKSAQTSPVSDLSNTTQAPQHSPRHRPPLPTGRQGVLPVR